MSPIADGHTNLDLIAALDAVPILVVGSYLGAISHTLTALEAMKTRNISPAAIVVNAGKEEAVSLELTCHALQQWISNDIDLYPLAYVNADIPWRKLSDLTGIISAYPAQYAV